MSHLYEKGIECCFFILKSCDC